MALAVQILIQQNSIEAAWREVKRMSEVDDDAILTQLATAWVSLASGNAAKYSEARAIFEDLFDRHGGAPVLLNGLAATHMQNGEWEDAESSLLEAQEAHPNFPETLANLAVCATHLGKSEDTVARYLTYALFFFFFFFFFACM